MLINGLPTARADMSRNFPHKIHDISQRKYNIRTAKYREEIQRECDFLVLSCAHKPLVFRVGMRDTWYEVSTVKKDLKGVRAKIIQSIDC